jgi:hypothetical protein
MGLSIFETLGIEPRPSERLETPGGVFERVLRSGIARDSEIGGIYWGVFCSSLLCRFFEDASVSG